MRRLAKPGRWPHTVAERGRLVVFAQGRWSSLVRSGDTMYGVANDPATGADIEIAFRQVEERFARQPAFTGSEWPRTPRSRGGSGKPRST